NVSLHVKLHHAMKRVSCALITSTAPDFAHTPLSLAEYKHYAASVKANSGRILGFCGLGAYPDTTSSRRLLANVRQAFDFYKRNSGLGRQAMPAGEAAIVYSYETRRRNMAEAARAHTLECFGMSRLLQECHIPWDFLIPEIDDSFEALSRYRLILLPAVSCLSDRFVESLNRYVAGGGRLLATGEAGTWKTADIRRRSHPLARVLGIQPQGGSTEGCFHVADAFEPIVMVGRAFKIAARGKVLRRIIPPGAARSVFVQKDIVPADRPAGPAVVKQRHESGASIYAAFEPGKFYYEQGHYQTRELLESMLDEIYPEPLRLIQAKLPDTVEVTVTEQPEQRRRIIHLVNKTTSGHYMGRETNHAIHQVVPLENLELTIRRVPTGAAVSLVDLDGTLKRSGNMLRVHLRRLEQYGAITIKIGETL
ncbi:MAG: beta-galactosidase trimerization domain-containing protein, partial [Kiritimatiellota bacterium]|nr:beta-galactosidase trimerization domain-containing protein [Kiritimatiellota bacterium]